MNRQDKRLQEILEQIEAGADPNAVIASLPPDEAAELGSLIRLAVTLRSLPHPTMYSSSDARTALPRSVEAAARKLRAEQRRETGPHTDRPRWRQVASRAYVLGFAALMLAIFAGVFILPSLINNRATTPTPTAITETVTPSATHEATEVAPTVPPPTAIPYLFSVLGDGPVIRHRTAQWDHSFTDPGAVIVQDGSLLMFRNGGKEFPGEYRNIPMSSEDGVKWSPAAVQPTFSSKDIPWPNEVAQVTSAITLDDGTWAIYFYTLDKTTAKPIALIGRAVGPTVSGPWTVEPEPVLQPGGPSTWDEEGVSDPSVIKFGGQYHMYYTGADRNSYKSIGLATSPDGVTWTKLTDPNAAYRVRYGGPVFGPGPKGEWDSYWVMQPSVISTPDGLVMLYFSVANSMNQRQRFGLATSEDGLHWTRYANNPVFATAAIPSARDINRGVLTYFKGAYLLYLEVRPGNGTVSDIWLAKHEGRLLP
jgi:predicted GH43/DUF377 family glycosyl hydrolase